MTHEILIVDDEQDIRQLASDILQDEGYRTRLAANSTEALEHINKRLPAAIILDIWLQDSELDGIGILEFVQQKYPNIPVIMISGHGNIETAISAIRIGAYDYLEKPFKVEKLLLILKRAIEAAKLRYENLELKLHLTTGEMIGKTTCMSQLRNTISRVAPTESRVMITGPAGVGKEVVARQIHLQSKRKDQPFVILNAASMNVHEIEIELFGTEPNYTDDQNIPQKIGTFERAHGGILFIDEAADMPLATQNKILRILQEQSFTRIGGKHKVDIDVRVISSTSRNLKELIQQGKFREDLYYRLNVVPIDVPALSARRNDIPLLCRHFLDHISATSGLGKKELSEDATIALQAYPWPGNVRQLRNIIEWLLIMAPDNQQHQIDASMLPPDITAIHNFQSDSETSPVDATTIAMPLRDAREVFEKHYLTAQINRFNGNISKTASFIGMERSALHRKLKSLHIGTEENKSNTKNAQQNEETTI